MKRHVYTLLIVLGVMHSARADDHSCTDPICDTVIECCSCDDHNSHCYTGRTHYAQRPQGAHHSRMIMGNTDIWHHDRDNFFASANCALSYSQSFDDNKITTWFLPHGSRVITFGPDAQPGDTTSADVRAIEFGLSPAFKGSVCLSSTLKHVIADIDISARFDDCLCGLWGRLNIPLTYAQWEVSIDEDITTVGDTTYPNQLVTAQTEPAVPVAFKHIRDAWCGDQGFGDAPALRAGKLCCNRNHAFHAAGIRADLGYNFINAKRWFAGAGLTVVAGVGTMPSDKYLFQPVIGAGKSWQVGGTFSTGCSLTHRKSRAISVTLDATAVHILRSTQHRVFGLKNNGVWSQYLLLKKFKADGTAYDRLERAANILAFDVAIGAAVMATMALSAHYRNGNGFGITVGAEGWVRTRETMQCICPLTIPDNTYGIKGNTLVAGADALKTASTSTIKTAGPADATTVFLTSDDIDVCPALHPLAVSGKGFLSIEQHWDFIEVQPFVSVGTEVEFGRGNTAINQWSIVFKGGASY